LPFANLIAQNFVTRKTFNRKQLAYAVRLFALYDLKDKLLEQRVYKDAILFSDTTTVRWATHQVGMKAIRQHGKGHLSDEQLTRALTLCQEVNGYISSLLDPFYNAPGDLHFSANAPFVRQAAVPDARALIDPLSHEDKRPMFGTPTAKEEKPSINFMDMPTKQASTFAEALNIVKKANNLCKAIEQRVMMYMDFVLLLQKGAFIQSVVEQLLPMPFPPNSPNALTDPVWGYDSGSGLGAMTTEDRRAMLAGIYSLARHYMAFNFSMPWHRTDTATRTLVMGGLLAVYGCVLRKATEHVEEAIEKIQSVCNGIWDKRTKSFQLQMAPFINGERGFSCALSTCSFSLQDRTTLMDEYHLVNPKSLMLRETTNRFFSAHPQAAGQTKGEENDSFSSGELFTVGPSDVADESTLTFSLDKPKVGLAQVKSSSGFLTQFARNVCSCLGFRYDQESPVLRDKCVVGLAGVKTTDTEKNFGFFHDLMTSELEMQEMISLIYIYKLSMEIDPRSPYARMTIDKLVIWTASQVRPVFVFGKGDCWMLPANRTGESAHFDVVVFGGKNTVGISPTEQSPVGLCLKRIKVLQEVELKEEHLKIIQEYDPAEFDPIRMKIPLNEKVKVVKRGKV
jgi:hypothetical protein